MQRMVHRINEACVCERESVVPFITVYFYVDCNLNHYLFSVIILGTTNSIETSRYRCRVGFAEYLTGILILNLDGFRWRRITGSPDKIRKQLLKSREAKTEKSNHDGKHLGAIRLIFSRDRFRDARPASSNLLSLDCRMCSCTHRTKKANEC